MAASELGPESKPTRRERTFVAIGVLILAIVPILLTEFPPATDLPQHIAQVRLLKEALAHPDGPYVIQWAAPNTLIYYLILGLWTLLPVNLVARGIMVLVVLLWVIAIHGLGARRGRAWPAVVVASWLIFNRSLYWGFLNFLVGFPAFVLWFILTTKDFKNLTWRLWAALASVAVLLYGSHALWFAVGVAWLVAIGLVKRIPARAFLFRLMALFPCGLASLLWYPALSRSRAMAGYDVAPHWNVPLDRLGSFMDAMIGGMPSLLAVVPFVAIYLWIGLAIWQNRVQLRKAMDLDLLAASAFFLVVFIVSPDKYMNTILFASRWLPPAMIFLLLALPTPSLRPRTIRALVGGLTIGFFLVTTFLWYEYDRMDLSGFRSCLEQIPGSSRILGLDLVKESAHIRDRPFLQLSAYAQVYKGGELNFSFAEHYSGLVVYRSQRDVRWTRGLDWFAERVKRSDFAFFDDLLVNGDEKDFLTLDRFSELSPVPSRGHWRLYRVKRP